MNEAKIKEVFSDEQFVKELFELETPEAIQSALADKDIDVTLDDIVKTRELLAKYNNGELSKEELESIAGGSAVPFFENEKPNLPQPKKTWYGTQIPL